MSPSAERPFSGRALLALLALFLAAQVYAYHWGVITPDTVEQYRQALSGRYDDWHPPVTAWLWRQLQTLAPGTAPILLFQCLLYWTGIGLVAEVLRRRGDTAAMALILLLALLPIPFGQIGAILKDPLMAVCCLAAAGLALFAEETGKRKLRGVAVALLVLASATRINAVFATAPLLAGMLPERLLERPWRALAALLGAGLLLVGASRLIDGTLLAPHRSQPFLSLVNFDLGGIVAEGHAGAYPNLDPATAARATAHCYDPRLYNPAYRPECDAVEDALATYIARRHRSAVAVWAEAIAAAPLAYLRHRIAHVNWNWRFLVPDVPDDAVYRMSQPNDLGIAFTPNPATHAIGRAARWMALSPLGRPATWLAVALALLLIARRLPSRRFVTALALSALLYGGAYALVSVAPDMRYNLWTLLAAMLALAVAVADLRRAATPLLPRSLLLMALAPVSTVAALEMAALLAG